MSHPVPGMDYHCDICGFDLLEDNIHKCNDDK